MSGMFSAGGLITGLDTNTLISQLIELERRPIARLQQRIAALETQRGAIGGVRTQLQTLRNRAEDFRLNSVFGQFRAASSENGILGTSLAGANAAPGVYQVEVLQLASATIARSSSALGAAISPDAPLSDSGIRTHVTAGSFTINGAAFTIDPETQSLNDILAEINSSGIGVQAHYDAAEDKVTLENSSAGDTSILNFGASTDTSNFLEALHLTGAFQATGANGATVVTSSRNLGAADRSEALSAGAFQNGAVTAGSFRINGIQINVDPLSDSLDSIITAINASDARVTASYDDVTDTLRIVSDMLGSRTIAFESGTSNFLDVMNLTTAAQTAGTDAQFTIDGGALQTRNTNAVNDAIPGVTLNLRGVGASSVTVETDTEAIVEGVRGLLTALNDALDEIRRQTGRGATLQGDSSISMISSQIQYLMFNQVEGAGDVFKTLLEIGISTGNTFDAEAGARFELDEETFLAKLRENPENLERLFSNSEQTGIANALSSYLEGATATTGFLNQRIRGGGSVDSQIQAYNDRIERLEYTIARHEERYRAQFARLEQMASLYQTQGFSLMGLGGDFSF
ncbi:MAG: flagellar filament capping protein FliD [Candidatus Hydrogenedentales bacterium]|jgi:flagellar hook-associated protein 2